MSDSAEVDLAGLYRATRERLSDLVSSLDAAALATAVPACPGWAVRDVVAHLMTIPEDAVAGRLSGLPSDDYNARQVTRLAEVPVAELLDRWSASAPQFEEIISTFRVWPALMDVASHEQDIRGAIGIPGARDSDAVRRCTATLLRGLKVPVAVRVVTEDGEYLAEGAAPELTLSTSRFEAFRWRMGRRSRAQLAALSWSGDPSAVLDHLAVFGPAASDIVE